MTSWNTEGHPLTQPIHVKLQAQSKPASHEAPYVKRHTPPPSPYKKHPKANEHSMQGYAHTTSSPSVEHDTTHNQIFAPTSPTLLLEDPPSDVDVYNSLVAQSCFQLVVNNPTAQQDEDTASGRKITNSRITIRNLTYTAPPQGGFPHPQITKLVTAGQSPQAIKLFNELPGYKIWVRPWAMRFTKDLHLPRQEINKTMMEFFDREPVNHLSLTQPSPDKAHENEADGSPWGFLISSISKAKHDMAIRTRVIASKQAILFISPYEQQIPSFVMMIMGISFNEGRINEAKTAVVEAFQRTLTTNPIISQTLMNLIEDPSQVHVEFEAFLAGITATHTC
ncbi:hypothetical protein AGABI1DRAFT_126275 [Agaricus bisporus var. burnettii JB137-S8]|uniref:Uncharacterized protein n=1 Tax=Agaricus bisporus var. burnettii (strain JB137-S8 / ATCC MYA-4627 / FGSC 10392) TaxID=597362 RepID=K5X272_AGABU|nr:uncharacterized protein AGABI1DRAFT_126275 [Agaricus bisporus var. burnettii JB137-S8]EKM81916.1 hypothetical protein AGABI1DRAFT_126275 [Agaricus bisporus var. burnettii JB137-S8]